MKRFLLWWHKGLQSVVRARFRRALAIQSTVSPTAGRLVMSLADAGDHDRCRGAGSDQCTVVRDA